MLNGGKGPHSRQTQDVVGDLEIGQPINSEEGSELQTAGARESKGVKVLSESRMREICNVQFDERGVERSHGCNY